MVICKLALESRTVQRHDAASAPCSSFARRRVGLADAQMSEAVAIVGCGLVGSGWAIVFARAAVASDASRRGVLREVGRSRSRAPSARTSPRTCPGHRYGGRSLRRVVRHPSAAATQRRQRWGWSNSSARVSRACAKPRLSARQHDAHRSSVVVLRKRPDGRGDLRAPASRASSPSRNRDMGTLSDRTGPCVRRRARKRRRLRDGAHRARVAVEAQIQASAFSRRSPDRRARARARRARSGTRSPSLRDRALRGSPGSCRGSPGSAFRSSWKATWPRSTHRGRSGSSRRPPRGSRGRLDCMPVRRCGLDDPTVVLCPYLVT